MTMYLPGLASSGTSMVFIAVRLVCTSMSSSSAVMTRSLDSSIKRRRSPTAFWGTPRLKSSIFTRNSPPGWTFFTRGETCTSSRLSNSCSTVTVIGTSITVRPSDSVTIPLYFPAAFPFGTLTTIPSCRLEFAPIREAFSASETKSLISSLKLTEKLLVTLSLLNAPSSSFASSPGLTLTDSFSLSTEREAFSTVVMFVKLSAVRFPRRGLGVAEGLVVTFAPPALAPE